jgi:hypothetical protein
MNNRTQSSDARRVILNTMKYEMQNFSLITLLQMKYQIRMKSNQWILLE